MGANLGDRRAALERAVELLGATPGISAVRISSLRETVAVMEPGQLEALGPSPPYLNGVAELSTVLTPRALLEVLLALETQLGRRRDHRFRYAPRALDLDLLLYGSEIVDEPDLQIPHPRLGERDFVLVPLAELAPDAIEPRSGLTVATLRDRLLRQTGAGP